MDKRYQVFVSSTYIDLEDERDLILKTLIKMDCIPSGMEYFPAMDEDQFKFIKRINVEIYYNRFIVVCGLVVILVSFIIWGLFNNFDIILIYYLFFCFFWIS